MLGQRLGDLILGGQFQLDQRLADPLAVVQAELRGAVRVLLRHDFHVLKDLTEFLSLSGHALGFLMAASDEAARDAAMRPARPDTIAASQRSAANGTLVRY